MTRSEKIRRTDARKRRGSGIRQPPFDIQVALGAPRIPDPMLFEEERHHEALERCTVRALAEGDYAAAFKFADRRCRIPPLAEAHHYTLRGQASYHMGDRNAAVSDIAQALKIAPDNLLANRRMLAWGEGLQQIEAARSLLRHEHDFEILASATAVLRKAGQRSFAAIQYTDTRVEGWAAWGRGSEIKITIVDADAAATTTAIPADRNHPLRDILGNAASFSLDRPVSHKPQVISLRVGRRLIHEVRARPNKEAASRNAWPAASEISSEPVIRVDESLVPHRFEGPGSVELSRHGPITIVVPVYDDYAATKACLESLVSELKGHPESRAILVDDATPDPRIRDYLDALAEEPNVLLLRNARNLGFVHSVNRALEEVSRGDVLLLNADTILPPGCIARLHAAAYSAPKIGTVTPFSNNGEIMSFPVANKPNPIAAPDEIYSLDAAAAVANAGKVVDIPNGIGFCLYITRDCLDAVGPLSDVYYRGYFEDVDLCLRGRERGFRNVCASSIYVGHAGSRSFGTERQSLIMQNLAVIELRFPKYRAECAAYLLADPLRPSRASIERALPPSSTGATLLITGMGAVKAVAEARAAALRRNGLPALIVEIQALGPSIHFFDPSKAIPQSVTFKLEAPEERSALATYLDRAQPSRLEIADPSRVPPALLQLLQALDVPIDLLIADAGLVCLRGSFLRDDGRPCNAVSSRSACHDCIDGYAKELGSGHESIECWRTRWQEVAARADCILAPSAHAAEFARRFLVDRPVTELAHPDPIAEMPRRDFSSEERHGLGFVTAGESAADYRLMRELARALGRNHPDLPVVVIGRCIDDVALMRLGNVFVTGAVEPEQYQRVLHQYRLKALLTASRRPLFGHPIMTDRAVTGLPTAFFDWSFGRAPARSSDLALDPRTANDAVAAELAAWFLRQIEKAKSR